MRPALLTLLLPVVGVAATEGDVLPDVSLQTADEKPTGIPSLGQKVLAIFYADGDVPDLNDPLADAITAANPNTDVYRGIGVANLADSKAPNFIIRSVIKGKIEKYESTIVTDPNRAVAKAWGLGDCNNTSVILVVGHDGKLRYSFKGAVRGEEIKKVVALIQKLIGEAEAAKATPAPAAAKPSDPKPEPAPAATP